MNEEPHLEAPGAGLPPLEGWILRHVGFPILCARMSRDEALSRFDREGRKALELARGCSGEELRRPILIERFRGIEDSSRNWSILMTVHHLLIVGKSMLRIARFLADGREFPREVRVADVKPDPEIGPEVLDEFEEWLEGYAEAVPGQPWPDTPKHVHPWFGPLGVEKWLKLNALHNGIHREQIERIRNALKSEVGSQKWVATINYSLLTMHRQAGRASAREAWRARWLESSRGPC